MSQTLGERLAEKLGEATFRKTADLGLENARRNLPRLGRTIADLKQDPPALADPDSAIVVCAGPSLHHRRSIDRIRDSGFGGAIVAVDGSLGHCLRAGLVPHYVLTLDPHPDRIVRWFGDPRLEERAEDDYFRRQDLDSAMADDERRRNREMIELVNRHGADMRAVAATCIDPGVAARCEEAGLPLYWWNPICDDPAEPAGVTRALHRLNRAPCMVTGGNCGTAAWILAHSVLGKRRVALVGMDLGYRPGTPLLRTQYYYELQELLGDRVADAYIPISNPHLGEEWYTDPTYWWYRSIFLTLAREAPCRTYNCTEGGTVFGEGIEFTPLEAFLDARTPAPA